MSALPRVLRYPALLVGSLLLIASTAAGPKQGMLRVTPAKASDGEIGRFQPQQVSGSVRVRYHGPRRFFQVTAQVWKDGQWTVCGHATGPTSMPLDRQVSVALHDSGRSADQTEYTGIVADRTDEQLQTIPFTIDRESSSGVGRALELRSSVNAPEEEPVAVWGYAVYADNVSPQTDEPIDQQAEKADYAIVVTVQMLDQPASMPHVVATDAAARGPHSDSEPPDDRMPATVSANAGGGSRFETVW